jgi:hypothetical protein
MVVAISTVKAIGAVSRAMSFIRESMRCARRSVKSVASLPVLDQKTCATTGTCFAAPRRRPSDYPSSRNIDMLTVKYHSLEPIVDPTPRTTSDEDISKAQATREALRRELLSRAEPE